ncbi:MAG TPA: DUF4384 domain-containing protein [Smithellaceae bacterium]|nr:DUF4384 domain-containing protein [Smithellaceae bacterium]
MMNSIYRYICVFLLLLCMVASSHAEEQFQLTGEIVKNIQAEGACAIVGMSAEQSQLIALQRARAAAIEQAAGVAVTSGTLVTNFTVAADFIKTYARGFIVREKPSWLPLGQYQKDQSVAPIPEYRIRISADVYVPKKTKTSVGLKAKLNSSVFRRGEKAFFTLRAAKQAGFAIFNIMADDRVALIYPNIHETGNLLDSTREMTFPPKDSSIELEVQTLPGHKRDAEAYLIIAWDRAAAIRILGIFPEAEPMSVPDFFTRLMTIADHIEDTILPYEVVAQ